MTPEQLTGVRLRLKDGIFTANLQRRRFGEWLRRRAFDTVNGGLGLGIIYVSYLTLTAIANDPNLSTIPHDVLPFLTNLLHLPLNNFSEATQQIGQIATDTFQVAKADINATNTNTLLGVGSGIGTDIVTAILRRTINKDEQTRRCVNSRHWAIAEILPDPRLQQPSQPQTPQAPFQPPLIIPPSR